MTIPIGRMVATLVLAVGLTACSPESSPTLEFPATPDPNPFYMEDMDGSCLFLGNRTTGILTLVGPTESGEKMGWDYRACQYRMRLAKIEAGAYVR